MDTQHTSLAELTVSVLGDSLAHHAALGPGSEPEPRVRALYDLVSARLRRAEHAGTVLDDLEGAPADPTARSNVRDALNRELDGDPRLRSELHGLVEAFPEYTPTGAGQGPRAVPGTPVSPGARTGNDPRSQRTRLVALCVVAALVLLCTGGIGYALGASSEPATEDLGADPGAAGVLELTQAVLEAYSEKDASMLCEVHHTEVLDRLRTRVGSCEDFVRNELTSIPTEALAEMEQVQVRDIDVHEDEARINARLSVKLEEALERDTLELHFERESGHWRMAYNGESML